MDGKRSFYELNVLLKLFGNVFGGNFDNAFAFQGDGARLSQTKLYKS
jgi:hypothetical protein